MNCPLSRTRTSNAFARRWRRGAGSPKPPRPIADAPAPVLNSATEKRYRAYALAGMERATAEIATLNEGRPSELFRSVCALGWSVANGVVGEAEFTAAYVNACRDNGLLARDGQRAIEASIRSGLERQQTILCPILRTVSRTSVRRPQKRKNPIAGLILFSASWLSMPDLEEDVEQLARLKILDYDRMRKTEAQRLGVSVSALDDAVKRKRASRAVRSSRRPAWARRLNRGLRLWMAASFFSR